MPIQIPFNFKEREYQLPLLRAMDSGTKRAVCVWHRRAGKDKTAVQINAKKMLERVGSYYYFFPEYNQGRKILWDGMDRNGFPFMSHFPKEIVAKKNDQEMQLTLKNGSIFQVIGTDKINAIVGTNPIGNTFSEYSIQNPQAWDFIRPILKENGGWALFLYTPRGKNHGFKLYEMARNNADWFAQKLTVDDTGIITPEMIQQERDEGMDEDLIQQEYYCSFSGVTVGSYYLKQLALAEKEGRIGNVPFVPNLLVDTWWDLGMDDATAIWFTQNVGKEIRVIDYLEDSGEGLEFYIKQLREKPYIYRDHFAPHDIKVRELGTGKSRLETAGGLGIRFQVAPQLGLEDGINAVRNVLPQCWFDETKCARGLDCLRQYHKVYDEEMKCYKQRPEHDWSSHGADAFRTFAVAWKDEIQYKPQQIETPSDPFNPFPEI
jgi:hypothetical protein